MPWSAGDDELRCERMRRKLLPGAVRRSLLKAAVLITVFELLKHEVLAAPYTLVLADPGDEDYFKALMEGRTFFTERYKTEVLALDKKKDPFRGAVAWLAKHEVISEAEIAELEELRQHRNNVVHQLAKFVIDVDEEVRVKSASRCIELLRKIAVWEARVDASCSEELASQGIKDEDVVYMPLQVTVAEMLVESLDDSGGPAGGDVL